MRMQQAVKVQRAVELFRGSASAGRTQEMGERRQISHPADRCEMEAQHVAAKVTNHSRSSKPAISRIAPGPVAHRAPEACGCSGCSATAPCKHCARKKSLLQRSSEDGAAHAHAADVSGLLHSSGKALEPKTRQLMEKRIGHDFGHVRVHTDAHAEESARRLRAKAYTAGSHVVFGKGKYSPQSIDGQKLIAHELVHVVQQAQTPCALIQRDEDTSFPPLPTFQLTPPRIGESIGWQRRLLQPPLLNLNILLGSPTQLDLNVLDRELAAGGPLTQTRGEIGYGSQPCPGRGSARNCQSSPVAEDSQLPLEAMVFPRIPRVSPTAPATTPPSIGSPLPSGTTQPPATTTRPAPAPRALVVGGIHGDEGGAPQHVLIAERLQTELNAGLARDFDTILIPVMNPGGLADNRRTNRHGVDLNRNFPGLPNFPSGTPVVEQPETAAVRRVVQILRPSRILVLHAQGDPAKGGVYADPVEGEARELACRMALRMRGTPPGSAVVPGNLLERGVCESRYPAAAEVEVTTAQSSLGAWGSAPTAVGGGGATVITHEIPDKDNLTNPLPEHGGGRSVDSMMPGIREFLLDSRRSPSEADALLARSVTNTFLSGQDTTADVQLRDAISAIVRRRFDDMNAFYSGVWRDSQPASVRRSLPSRLTIVASTGVRDFSRQAGIVNAELRRTLTASSTDSEIEREILRVMETRSMPGFSRHHWGTDMDIVSAERGDWDPVSGRFRALIPFLQEHAMRFGFFHPYTAGYSRPGGQPTQAGFPTSTARHYLEEPWHLSYWPISNVLQRLWLQTFTGPILNNLILETARAVHGSVPEAAMARVLGGIGLSSFQGNVAPSP